MMNGVGVINGKQVESVDVQLLEAVRSQGSEISPWRHFRYQEERRKGLSQGWSPLDGRTPK